MIILDTNVLSALMIERPITEVAVWLDRQPTRSIWTTSITVFEVHTGVGILPAGRRRTLLEQRYEILLGARLEGRILHFDRVAAEEAAILAAHRQRNGVVRELRDTMIAGIALANNAALATHNVRHFDDLRVPVIDPWSA